MLFRSNEDIWGSINSVVKKVWFIPSREEWAAFSSELNVTDSNYQRLNFGDGYWSSSQRKAKYAWHVSYIHTSIGYNYVYGTNFVRFAKTF